MQPYFSPYLGYFSLIKHSDQFILFDPVQHIRHGWIERNRILKPVEGWQYIGVSLEKHSRDTLIKELRIKNNTDWQDRIFRQLEHYKKRAPFYTKVIDLLHACFEKKTTSIVKLNEKCLSLVCEYIGIEFRSQIFSEMNLEVGTIKHPGEWAVRISEAMNASTYINPHGGMEIFNKQEFGDAKIELKFMQPLLSEYSQRRPAFEPGLSIIDVMMFNNEFEIRDMIDEFKYV